ncbi:MAG: hypothetical protein PVG78_03075 [Desulfobacterales bacterium]|jgi:hypothetical protein
MGFRAKWQLIIGIFTACWLVYFLVPCFGQQACFDRISNLFDSEVFNLVFLMILFLTVSALAADAVEFFFVRMRRLPWFRPRLGEILVARGFISETELTSALDEQRLRIGDILLQAGRSTAQELEHAAEYSRSQAGMRIGEALVELGYATEDDISWALKRSNRKLGEVLVEKGLINEFDLRHTLGRMWYVRFRGF